MQSLGFELQQETNLAMLTADVVKSSEIEGEILDPDRVRSSVARRLHIEAGGVATPIAQDVEGILTVMLDATANYEQPLTSDRMLGWHSSLFPGGWSGSRRISVGVWRDGPMQVVSSRKLGGPERVHFEAPSPERVEQEMRDFLDWFNATPGTDPVTDPVIDPVLKAGLAHLWFVTVHPFDDGNGRIARAIADMALARSEGSPRRFYSMSSQIMRERNAYYETLERTQTDTMDVTAWLDWFVGCLGRAIDSSEETISAVLRKARFWDRLASLNINDRQHKVIGLLLGDFQGNLTTSKWANIGKCSHDTALRDINALVDQSILARSAEGGRSTNYFLVRD